MHRTHHHAAALYETAVSARPAACREPSPLARALRSGVNADAHVRDLATCHAAADHLQGVVARRVPSDLLGTPHAAAYARRHAEVALQLGEGWMLEVGTRDVDREFADYAAEREAEVDRLASSPF